MNEELKGAIFQLGGVPVEDRDRYSVDAIPDSTHHELIQHLFHLAGEHPDKRTDIYALAEMAGVKPPAIRKRALAMVALGLFTESDIRLNLNTRAVKLYQLVNLAATDARIDVGRKAIGRAQRQQLEQLKLFSGEFSVLEDYLTQGPVVDDFFCGLLYGAMRIGRRDQRKVISVSLKWGKEPVRVVSTADSETGICYVRDLRFVMGVLAVIKQIIDEQREKGMPHRNHFSISIYDLLEIVGLKNQGGNRSTAYSALLRIEGTKFTFQHPISQALRGKFGDDIWGTQGFRFFSGLGVYGHKDHIEGHVPDTFIVSLANVLYERMIDEGVYSLFRISEHLPKDSNDISHAMSLWCRRMVRHGNNRNLFTIEYFIKAILPQVQIKKAREMVYDYLLAHVYEAPPLPADVAEDDEEIKLDKGLVTSLVYGYLITLYTKHVHIRPDPNDEIVGLNSVHLKLKRAQDELKCE
jgi:hypothetical protein